MSLTIRHFIFSTAALSIAAAAVAAPQTFKSRGGKGEMNDYYRITVTRDCTDLSSAPYVKCTRQAISVADNTGKITGRFDVNEIPINRNGTHKVNLAKVYSVDEDLGGGDAMRYFMLRFVPQDITELNVLPSGQMFPKYYEIITDAELRPLKGMRLSSNGAAETWLDAKTRKHAKKKGKAQDPGADEPSLTVTEYVKVMDDR